MLIFGECDSCCAKNRVLHKGVGCGVEGVFCADCRHVDPRDEAYEIEEEIEAIESDPSRHGQGEHRALLLANLKAELARVDRRQSALVIGRCQADARR